MSTDAKPAAGRASAAAAPPVQSPPAPAPADQSTAAPPPAEETAAAPEVDMDTLMGFVMRSVGEVGATVNTALVVMGDKLGYYRHLAAHGPTTPAELAMGTGTAEPYAREWLNAQAAGDFVTYDPATGRYTLPPEQAVALTMEDSPAFLPGLLALPLSAW